MRSDLNSGYFDWMCNLVCSNKYSRVSYRKLLLYLNDTEFDYILLMDGNRAEDGIGLRYRYADERNYDSRIIASELDNRPCSILEMMIALSIRCEENIMDNPDIGDRTGQWFWGMIVNLGLGSMTDNKFDEDYVDDVIYRFLNRDYGPNGEGGLFTVKHPRQDLRNVDIWYQLCWYLDEFIG